MDHMTNAEIAEHMGWKGRGSYSATAMRKARSLMDVAAKTEREACAKEADAQGCNMVALAIRKRSPGVSKSTGK